MFKVNKLCQILFPKLSRWNVRKMVYSKGCGWFQGSSFSWFVGFDVSTIMISHGSCWYGPPGGHFSNPFFAIALLGPSKTLSISEQLFVLFEACTWNFSLAMSHNHLLRSALGKFSETNYKTCSQYEEHACRRLQFLMSPWGVKLGYEVNFNL